MTSTLFGSLQKIILRKSAAAGIIYRHRILQSTSLFASSTKRRSFGQLVSSDLEFFSGMNEPTCPCCSFLGKGLFLPWGDTSDCVGAERTTATDEPLSAVAVDVLSPSEAWQAITSARANVAQQQQPIALVDTHGHPHLDRSVEYASQVNVDNKISSYNDPKNVVVSITCAVSPLDWNAALEYASRSQHILPALGVHPWYLHDIIMENIIESNKDESTADEPTPHINIEQYLKWEWLSELETNLSQHPNLIVGEIGLCKMARFVREFPKELGGKATALQLQKIVFKKQMELAAQWRRPVTVHCVNAHGLLIETLTEMLNEARESCSKEEKVSNTNDLSEKDGTRTTLRNAFPPAIAMHSFTGTAHQVQQILDFEKSILHPEQVEAGGKRQRGKKKQQKQQQNQEKEAEGATDILFYFGYSHSVNYIMCTSEKAKRKGIEAVKAIPSDRLLVESDVHASADVVLGTAGAVAYAANARGESLKYVAESSTRNGLRFISSLNSLPVDS
jgi:Tat protein secretion system quality control protein TatD with DNase activity